MLAFCRSEFGENSNPVRSEPKATFPRPLYRRSAGWSLAEAPWPHALTPQGGRVRLDDTLRDLWLAADGRSLADVVASSHTGRLPERTIRAALACLAEAGLLTRSAPKAGPSLPEPVHGRLVSAVIVAFDGRDWLARLLPTLLAQTYSPTEVIVVDNGSTDGTAEWLSASFPAIRTIVLGAPRSFAHAVNRGVAAANGELSVPSQPGHPPGARRTVITGPHRRGRSLVRGGRDEIEVPVGAGVPERPGKPRRRPFMGVGQRHWAPGPRPVRRMADRAIRMLRRSPSFAAGRGVGGGAR